MKNNLVFLIALFFASSVQAAKWHHLEHDVFQLHAEKINNSVLCCNQPQAKDTSLNGATDIRDWQRFSQLKTQQPSDDRQISPIPLPATLWLLIPTLVALIGLRNFSRTIP